MGVTHHDALELEHLLTIIVYQLSVIIGMLAFGVFIAVSETARRSETRPERRRRR